MNFIPPRLCSSHCCLKWNQHWIVRILCSLWYCCCITSRVNIEYSGNLTLWGDDLRCQTSRCTHTHTHKKIQWRDYNLVSYLMVIHLPCLRSPLQNSQWGLFFFKLCAPYVNRVFINSGQWNVPASNKHYCKLISSKLLVSCKLAWWDAGKFPHSFFVYFQTPLASLWYEQLVCFPLARILLSFKALRLKG